MRRNLQYPSNRSPIARDLHELSNGWVRIIWHIALQLVYNVWALGLAPDQVCGFSLLDAHIKICVGRPNRGIPFITARGSRRVCSRRLL